VINEAEFKKLLDGTEQTMFNFTKDVLIDGNSNSNEEFLLLAHSQRILSSDLEEKAPSFQADDSLRFELTHSAILHDSHQLIRPFQLKYTHHDLVSSVSRVESIKTRHADYVLPLVSDYECYRQCLTDSNKAAFFNSTDNCLTFSFCNRGEHDPNDRAVRKCKFSSVDLHSPDLIRPDGKLFTGSKVIARDHCQVYQLNPSAQFTCANRRELLGQTRRAHKLHEQVADNVTECALSCLTFTSCVSFSVASSSQQGQIVCTFLSAHSVQFTAEDFVHNKFNNSESCMLYTSKSSHRIQCHSNSMVF
jgi:hypothetical protein